MPHFKNDRTKEGKSKIYSKVVAEIRWPGSLFRIMANSIMDEIQDYDDHEKKKSLSIEFLKQQDDDVMVG